MEKIFDATIVQVGPEAESMIEGANMFILFGEGAPADLAEFCFNCFILSHCCKKALCTGVDIGIQRLLLTVFGD